MNGSVDMTVPADGECVGATLASWKVSSLFNVLAISRASSLLKLWNHFWTSCAIVASVEALADLLSELDFAGCRRLGLRHCSLLFLHLFLLLLSRTTKEIAASPGHPLPLLAAQRPGPQGRDYVCPCDLY